MRIFNKKNKEDKYKHVNYHKLKNTDEEQENLNLKKNNTSNPNIEESKKNSIHKLILRLADAVFMDDFDEIKKIFDEADENTKKILSQAHMADDPTDHPIRKFAKAKDNTIEEIVKFLYAQYSEYHQEETNPDLEEADDTRQNYPGFGGVNL